MEKFDTARKEETYFHLKTTAKDPSFHLGGIRFHTMFWQHVTPFGKGRCGLPKGDLTKAIEGGFGEFDRFR